MFLLSTQDSLMVLQQPPCNVHRLRFRIDQYACVVCVVLYYGNEVESLLWPMLCYELRNTVGLRNLDSQRVIMWLLSQVKVYQ